MKLSHILSFVLGIVLAVLVLDKCNTSPNETVQTRIDSVVVLDTQFVNTKPRIDTYWRDTGRVVLDTVQVLRDWSSTYVYADSVRDGDARIDIIDTVTRNTITGRSVRYVLPTTTITQVKTVTKRSGGTYLHLTATQDKNVSASVLVVQPKWTAQIGYGTNGVQVGAGIKLGL